MCCLLLLVFQAAPPIHLVTITAEQARRLDGKRVRVVVVVGKPAYSWRGSTILGVADRPDGIERSAYLQGERLDVEEGDEITIVGTLRLIQHPAHRVNGVFVQEWEEVRIEGEKASEDVSGWRH